MTIDKVFDGEVLTWFEADDQDNGWVGLDLGESKTISKIRFLPRTTGNRIYEGHTYELFYWDGQKWASLGRQVAESHQLQYSVPANSLLNLRNLTLFREGRYFTMQDGSQRWL